VTVALYNPPVLRASDYIDPSVSYVSNAIAFANVAIEAMSNSPQITVDFGGVRSVSSSFFNMLLSRIVEELGVDALRTRVSFRFSSTAQKVIFDRSFQAVLRAR
jgi:STAS-like domain of unknown function (DUF4325)